MILVSIAITTYNHAKYLKKCLDSALMQETTFNFEIVIGEDCSTDDTRAICLAYKELFPDKIRLLLHHENIGFRENNKAVWSSCKGKYIAYLEGDDFWIHKNKLQMQIDYLEQSNEIMGSGHQTELWFGENDVRNKMFSELPDLKRIDFDANIEKWLFATCSFVFRNFFVLEEYKVLKENFFKDKMFWSDRPLMVLLALYGDFVYHNHNYGCWRQHDKNMTKIGNSMRMNEEGGKAYTHIGKLYPQHKVKISELTLRWYLLAARDAFKNRDIPNFIKNEVKALSNIRGKIHAKNFIKCTAFILVGKEIY